MSDKGYLIDGVKTTIVDSETGKAFNSEEAFQKDYEDRHYITSGKFWDDIKTAILGSTTNPTQPLPMMSENTGRYNLAQTFAGSGSVRPYNTYDSWEGVVANGYANYQSIPSGVNSVQAIASTLAKNADITQDQNPQDVSAVGQYLSRIGEDREEAVTIPNDIKKDVLAEAKLTEDNPEWTSFLQQHKNLVNWLQNEYNYARVKDDIKPQSTIASLLQSGAIGAITADLRQERGELYWRMANGEELSERQQARIKVLEAMIKKLNPEDRSSSTTLGDRFAQSLGGTVAPLGQGVSMAGKLAFTGAVVGSAGGVAGSTALSAAGATYGLQAGFLRAMAVEQAGNFFGDTYEKTGQKPTWAATARALSSVVLNNIGVNAIGRAYAVADKVGISKALKEAGAKTFAFTAFSGGADFFADEMFRRTYGVGNTQTTGELLQATAENAVFSGTFGTLISTPAMGFAGLRMLKDQVNETNLMKRGDVDTQAEVINNMVAGTPLDTVQVPPKAVADYMNRPEVTQQDMADYQRIVPNSEDFDLANQTGGTIDIPLGQFMTVNDNMVNALLADARFNNHYSFNEYQQAIRDTEMKAEDMQAQLAEGEQSAENVSVSEAIGKFTKGNLLNMLEEIQNKSFNEKNKKFEQTIQLKGKERKKHKKTKDDVADAQEAVAQVDEQPVYRVTNIISAEGSPVADAVKEAGNAREWARAHINGFETDAEQAYIDEVALDNGYKSGGHMMWALAQNKTREEAIADAMTKQEQESNFLRDDTELTRLDQFMERVSDTAYILSRIADGDDLQEMGIRSIEEIQTSTDAKVKFFEQQIKTLQGEIAGMGSDVAKSVKQGQIEKLRNDIKIAKMDAADEIKKVRRETTKKVNERWKEKNAQDKAALKQEAKDAVKAVNDKFRSIAENVNLAKKTAKKNVLTPKQARENARAQIAMMPIGKILKERNKMLTNIRVASLKANRLWDKGGAYNQAVEQLNYVVASTAFIREAIAVMQEKVKLDKQGRKLARMKMTSFADSEGYAQFYRVLHNMGFLRLPQRTVTQQVGSGSNIRTINRRVNARGLNANERVTMPLSRFFEQEGMRSGRGYQMSEIMSRFWDGGWYRPTSVLDMTITDYANGIKLAKEIKEASRRDKDFYDSKRKGTIENLTRDMIADIKNHTPEQNKGRAFDPSEKLNDRIDGRRRGAVRYFDSLINPDNWLTRMEGLTGHLHTWFSKQVMELGDKKAQISQRYISMLNEANNLYTASERRKMSSKNIYIEEQGGITVSKNDLIGLAMSAGSKHNWTKMFSVSQGSDNVPIAFKGATDWTETGVLRMLGKYLDKRDFDFIQRNWEVFDDLWENYCSKYEKARTGFYPEKAPLHPYEVVLSDNSTLKLLGGFFPLVEDSRAQNFKPKNMPVEDMNELNLLDNNLKSYTDFMTNQSQYKKRTNKAYIIDVDYATIIPSYLDRVIHDLAFREWVYATGSILRNPEFRNTILTRHSDDGLQALEHVQKRILGGGQPEMITQPMNQLMAYAKRAGVTSAVGSLGTIVQGVSNIFIVPYSDKNYGIIDTAKGYLKYGVCGIWSDLFTANFKEVQRKLDETYALSPAFREMGQSLENELYGIRQQPKNRFDNFTQNCTDAVTLAMRSIDRMTLQPQYMNMLEKFQKEYMKQGMSETEAMKEAVYRANLAMERIVPSARRYRLNQFADAPVGSAQWFVSGLSSYLTTMLNRIVWTYEAGVRNGLDIPFVVGNAMCVLVIAPLATSVISGLSPLSSNKDDAMDADNLIKWGLYTIGSNVASMFPIVGTALQGALAVTTDQPYFGGRTPVGLYSTIEQISRAGKTATTFVKQQFENVPLNRQVGFADAAEAGAKAASLATGVPIGISNTFFNIIMYMDGAATPEARDILRRRPYDERE